jgi:hypothetical protein
VIEAHIGPTVTSAVIHIYGNFGARLRALFWGENTRSRVRDRCNVKYRLQVATKTSRFITGIERIFAWLVAARPLRLGLVAKGAIVTQNNTLIEYQARASMLQPVHMDILESATRVQSPQASAVCVVDEALADSFPASDPPLWTSGIATPGPAVRRTRRGAHSAFVAARDLMRRVAALL